jgi:hypothetical protein
MRRNTKPLRYRKCGAPLTVDENAVRCVCGEYLLAGKKGARDEKADCEN